MTVIKPIAPEDVRRLAFMARSFHKARGLPGALNIDWWIAWWGHALTSDTGLIVAAYDGPLIRGAIGAAFFPDPCDGALTCQELFWGVHDTTPGDGMRLLKALEQFSKRAGVKRIIMSALCNETGVRLGPIYERWGYRPLEASFVKEIA